MVHDVLIVGAGTAGLAVAHELQVRGVAVQIIEAAPGPGASWRGRHEQLSLNTHRRFSGLPGAPLPAKLGVYVSREDFIRHIEAYAAALGPVIRYGVQAEGIERAEVGGWIVQTDQGELPARHVIIATGPERQPVIPEWPGRELFHGELIHSAAFRHAEDYVGKRVLLVGASNSGVDVGNHLSEVAIGPSWVSLRSGPTIVPERVFGISAHLPFMLLRPLPIKAQDWMVALLGRVFLGDLRQYGLPKPKAGAVTRDMEDGVTFGVDRGFVRALKAGRFTVVPEIRAFHKTSVELVDGRHLEPDVVICATGYRPGLEPLIGPLNLLNARGNPPCHFERTQSSGSSILKKREITPTPGQPGLWFFGLNSSIYGYLHARKLEAPLLAERIARELR
ncbi:MAG: NAD(P)/FAD-dependent oxidoreductase, partial [Anaerolineales bacterium]|nr:NAD(P)/FAD-dependent oxidoreductase [Anaerolineales bacterium]